MCFDHVSNQIKTIAAQVEQAMIFLDAQPIFLGFSCGICGQVQ
jgi:hypothetical protein